MDWIKARTECSLEHVWLLLRQRMLSDLEQWKTTQQFLNNRKFYKTSTDDVLVSVTRETNFITPHASLYVTKTTTSIRWDSSTGDSPVTRNLTCVLNLKGECRIVYEGEEMEIWQVSKLILEPVLFPV